MDEYIVDTVKIHSSRVILKLKSIDTRPSAESLVKADVCIHESQAVKRSEWEFFHHELIGLQVTTITGQHVGILKDVWQTGANDVYVVRDEEGGEYLIPAVRDVIKLVDIAHRRLEIYPLEGMIGTDED